VRVLIFHGYLLRGTGSNVYNASLARALARLGHEVHLLCQERSAAELDWVSSLGRWRDGVLRVERLREASAGGSVTVHLPEIGELLPVYVADRYEGFRVKTFPQLTDAELDRYLEANVGAVRDVIEVWGEPDAALANHLIMGPAILARAGLRFAAKVHGSDLSYTVRPHPERFVPFAREGLARARCALVGSRHIAESLWETVPDPSLPGRTRLGPPGVDTERFVPRERRPAIAAVQSLAARLEQEGEETGFGRHGAGAAEALRGFASAAGPRVLFVGKLIVSKGADLLICGWPLVLRQHPGARLLLAGFGGYRQGLQTLWAALARGDLAGAREVATRGRGLEGGEERSLPILSAFLARPPRGYLEAAREAGDSVAFSGGLEHDEVAEVLPAADVLVMPSTFPEAFGMVAAEAAACGVLPVSADHSGMQEVSRQLGQALDPPLRPLLSFPIGPGSVTALAERVNGWLSLAVVERREAGHLLAARAEELWSWEGVARGVIAASRGDLDPLPPVPTH
jgi:glycosyltransferase involved in cell wall biosynthesis